MFQSFVRNVLNVRKHLWSLQHSIRHKMRWIWGSNKHATAYNLTQHARYPTSLQNSSGSEEVTNHTSHPRNRCDEPGSKQYTLENYHDNDRTLTSLIYTTTDRQSFTPEVMMPQPRRCKGSSPRRWSRDFENVASFLNNVNPCNGGLKRSHHASICLL